MVCPPRCSPTGSARRTASPRACRCAATTEGTGIWSRLGATRWCWRRTGWSGGIRAALARVSWGLVVADEAQHVKNPLSRTARELRAIPAAARLALTGTPVENRLTELWSILDWAARVCWAAWTASASSVADPRRARYRDEAATAAPGPDRAALRPAAAQARPGRRP